MATSAASSTITLTGASRAQYNFTLYPLGTQFKPVCAVYGLFSRRPDGYHPVYVGQTGDCSARFDDHHKAGCFQRHQATDIALLLINDEEQRCAIELDLIRGYNWPCNG